MFPYVGDDDNNNLIFTVSEIGEISGHAELIMPKIITVLDEATCNTYFYAYTDNNMLRIVSPQREIITLYSLTGVPLYSTMKDSGKIEIPTALLPSVFIIKGTLSGSIKIINN